LDFGLIVVLDPWQDQAYVACVQGCARCRNDGAVQPITVGAYRVGGEHPCQDENTANRQPEMYCSAAHEPDPPSSHRNSLTLPARERFLSTASAWVMSSDPYDSVFEVSHWFDQCDLNSFERAGSRVLPACLMSPPKENSMSEAYQSLTHSRWNCKYHVVFVPKRRRKALFGYFCPTPENVKSAARGSTSSTEMPYACKAGMSG
jgi:hypothetical protein